MKKGSGSRGAAAKERMIEAADRYEQELNADPSLADVEPSPWVYESLKEMIAREEEKKKVLTPEEQEALEIGQKVLKRRKHTRTLKMAGLAAAAAVVCSVGVSMSSQANRLRVLNAWYMLTGQEMMLQVGNDGEVDNPNFLAQKAGEDIWELIGIKVPEFMYFPNGVEFKEYTTDKKVGRAKLLYSYGETLFYVEMRKINDITEQSIDIDGKVLETFSVDTKYTDIMVYALEAPENERDYMAEFIYDNCQYTVYGIMEKEEFTKILENMIF